MFITILTIAVGLIVLASIIGLFLPTERMATRTLTLPHEPELVWRIVSDVEQYPFWMQDLRAVKRLDDENGGETWELDYEAQDASMIEITEKEPMRVFATRLRGEPGMEASRTIRFASRDGDSACTLEITEQGHIRNPFYRFVGSIMLTRGTLTPFVDRLSRRAGELAGQVKT